MSVELREGGKQRLPDEEKRDNDAKPASAIQPLPPGQESLLITEPSPPEWRRRCPEDEWTFTSATEVKNIKNLLSSDRLTHFMRSPEQMDEDTNYWEWIPRKLKQELKRKGGDADAPGWGLVLHVEFSYVTFLFIWGVVTLCISLILSLGLCVPKKAPLHGSVGAAIAIFFGPFGVLGLMFTAVYNYAKHKGFLK
jgi:hypothetical protein